MSIFIKYQQWPAIDAFDEFGPLESNLPVASHQTHRNRSFVQRTYPRIVDHTYLTKHHRTFFQYSDPPETSVSQVRSTASNPKIVRTFRIGGPLGSDVGSSELDNFS
jgi:hypothetical protein